MGAPATSLRGDAGVIGLVGSGHFFSHFYMLVLPPLFPILKAEFGVSYTALGGLITAFALASAATQLPCGFVVDRVGARYPLIAGLALVSAGIALTGLTSTYAGLLALTLAAGLGGGVFHPADYTILSARVAPARLGRAFSIHTFTGLVGWSMAPPVMIFLTSLWSWRAALVIVGCAGLGAALVLALNRERLKDDGQAAVGARRRDRAGGPGAGNVALLLSTPILLVFLFFVINAMTMSGFRTFSVTALVQLHGLDLAGANAALTGFLAGGAVGVLLGGVVADRTTRYEAVAAVGFLGAATLVALVASLALPLGLLVSVFALAGLMLGSIAPSRDMIVRSLTPKGASGKVFGFVSSGLDVGGALSPVLFGWIVDQGRPEGVFWLTAVFMMLALGAATAAARLARRRAVAYAAE